MQFEEFDNKVREAAEHHHPAYDEKAWDKMEKLLDRHLPQKKDDRRRFFFIILFFLLLGGGAWLLISNSRLTNKHIAIIKPVVQKSNSAIPGSTSEEKADKSDILPEVSKEKDAYTNAPDSKPETVKQTSIQTIRRMNLADKRKNMPAVVMMDAGKKINQEKERMKVEINQPGNDIANNLAGKKISEKEKSDLINSTIQDDQKNTELVAVEKPKSINDAKPVTNEIPGASKEKEEKAVVDQKPSTGKTKLKSKKTNTFFFTFSAGADVSAVNLNQLGKIKLLTGGGMGYTFKDRLTVRTGFYTGRKVYTASPKDYYPPDAFWSYYPNLQKVDADCKVYEIPLSLNYNFNRSSKQQFFASAGISSLLMKSETYNYFYKYTASGPTVTRKYTILDQNKHYFSILTLSGGYQKNIGKHFAVTVEPYLKIPLNGIGYGKVKLNSGGLLFSVDIKPFNASKK